MAHTARNIAASLSIAERIEALDWKDAGESLSERRVRGHGSDSDGLRNALPLWRSTMM